MEQGEERQDRAEAILHALDVAEDRERAEVDSGVEQRVQRLQAAREHGVGDTIDDGLGEDPTQRV